MTQKELWIDKDYYNDLSNKTLVKTIKLGITTLFLLMNASRVLGDNSGSNESLVPGFQVVASLITLGIIAFLAPFLRKDKNENQ